jgi:hypothetical protein
VLIDFVKDPGTGRKRKYFWVVSVSIAVSVETGN